jgi:hypothetical protein
MAEKQLTEKEKELLYKLLSSTSALPALCYEVASLENYVSKEEVQAFNTSATETYGMSIKQIEKTFASAVEKLKPLRK